MSDNILERIIRPSARGRVWQVFVLLALLVLVTGIYTAGPYYNRATDRIYASTNELIKLPKVSETPFRLGLDLQGGTHLVYQADMSNIDPLNRSDALEGSRDVIERRVNIFGVSEPVVQSNTADYRIIVELAGVKNVDEAIAMIGETPILEFKEQSTAPVELTAEQKDALAKENQAVEQRAEETLGKAISGGDFAALAREFSEDEASRENGGEIGFITAGDDEGLYSFAAKLTPGSVAADLYRSASGYEIVKLLEKRQRTDPFNDNAPEKEIQASHILICYQGAESCSETRTKDEAYALAKKLKAEATPANFADLARKNSNDTGSGAKGGDLGWFGPGMMVEPFEQAAGETKVGAISYIVETKFGYHIIYKRAERNIEELKIAHIAFRTKTEADITGGAAEWANTELTGKNLERATVQFNPNDNSPEISLEFDAEGAQMFEDITARNVGRPVAIYLDGEPVTIPTVNEKISGGKAVISGKFTLFEAKERVRQLNAGALPVPIKLISQETIGASLGQESLDKSLRAGLFGLLLVAAFMILYYRLPGLLSVIALMAYGVLLLFVFKYWPVTLSLSGLAAFIVSIGMAVDANVLIFERLREELSRGRAISASIKESFARAWPSIRDSQLSTLLTCLILIQISTSVVKGFAIVLGLGVIVSLFSAVFITRNLMDLIVGPWLEKRPWLLARSKSTK